MENEHFLSFKKSSEIKFPWVVGPFIIKNRVSFPVVENLLKEIGFQTDAAANYDFHHIISIKIQVNKNKPFEHHEIVGMDKSSNWMDYPHETQRNEDMQQGSTSSIREASSKQLGPSSIVPAAEKITPISSCSERTNKRDFFDVMDTKEEDTAKTPKK